MKFAADDKHRI